MNISEGEMMIRVIVLTLMICTLGCVHSPEASATNPAKNSAKKSVRDVAAKAGGLTLASYNVENLFDTVHDEGKEDAEFLPNSNAYKQKYCGSLPEREQKRCLENDWTEEKLALKLSQIKKVHDKFPNRPAMMGLVEVENENVVRRLADHLGYSSVLVTDSPDVRGIDVGLVYNESADLRYIRHATHRLNLAPFGGKATRDLLEVEFKAGPKQETLVVIVCHWPSQANSTATRIYAAQKTSEIAQAHVRQGHHVVVMGDFNVELMNDVPSPFGVFGDPATNATLVDLDRLHRMGAKNGAYSVADLSIGTYFYAVPGYDNNAPAMVWNMLDHFFVSRSLLKENGMRASIPSYRIVRDNEMTTPFQFTKGPYQGTIVQGTPKRYDHNASTPELAGYSDHFPIVFDLLWN